MINNPKIGQKVWFLEPWGQCIHSAKITALGETEVSVRNPEKYPYADIEWDDGGNSGCLLKNLYASREELQKELKKEDREAVLESVGVTIDTLNLQWIYRAKRYYGMKAADVYALIIPVHYRLNLEQVKRMAEAESTEEMLNFAKETRYGKYLQEMEKPNLERVGSMIQENVHRALMRQNPYSAACLEVYLYRKEQEVHRIITAMECVRYGLPAEKIREYLA